MNTRNQQAERFDEYEVNVGRTVGGFLVLAAIGGVLWIYFGMVKMDRWPIRWLEVDGAFERVSAEQVRTRIAPLVGGSFFAVDDTAIREAAGNLPWVAGVSVEKRWPDTVRIVVAEYLPVAHWRDEELIATNGDIFQVPGSAQIQGMPRLSGPVGSVERVIEHWQLFNNLLLPTGQEIREITLDRRGSWRLRLSNDTRVEMGREDGEVRLKRMAASWSELWRLKGMAPLLMDLRYANGFAVQWPEVRSEEEDERLVDNR